MGNFYLYATAVLGHWWPLVSAGSLLGIEEYAERYWRKASLHLKKIPTGWRHNIKVLTLIFAALYSGYLAWSDEHKELVELKSRISEYPHQAIRQLTES